MWVQMSQICYPESYFLAQDNCLTLFYINFNFALMLSYISLQHPDVNVMENWKENTTKHLNQKCRGNF